MHFLSDDELNGLVGAEETAFPSPVPTQIVSSDEYLPSPQTKQQKEVEGRLIETADRARGKLGLSRRRFFQTASGMAASFVAMNAVYGPVFDATLAEAAEPDAADERAKALAGQFIMDTHTHFLRDDTKLMGFIRMRESVGKAGWNTKIGERPQTI